MAKASVTKIRKGSYRLKLPKRLPKKKALVVVDALPLFDAVPLSVVGYAQVNADGTLDSAKVSRNVRVWRISKGYYNVMFDTNLMVRSVLVQPLRKSRSPRVIARVCPLIKHRVVPDNMNAVEIFLMTLRGVFVDCPFALIGVTDGVLTPKKSVPTSQKSSRRDDK